MTHEEAKQLKEFKHYCTCGGYAWSMNGRSKHDPHLHWCPQKTEYDEWWQAMHQHDDIKK
jgi:hypothetical protein